MSKIEVDKVDPQSGTTLTLGTSGDTVSIPSGVTLANSGTMTGVPVPTTGIAASAISSGTIATARLGSGTASSSTFLRGDQTYAEAGGGSLTFLNTSTGSNVSSIDINGHFTSDYAHYKLIYSLYAATGNTDSMCRIMQSGSVVTSSNYWYAGMGMYRASGNTSANNTGDNGADKWLISSSDNTADSQYPCTGEMILFNPLSTSQNTTMTTTNLGYNSGSPPNAIRIWTFGGQYVDAAASSGISFSYEGGNINGTVRLYGIKNS